jgi:hypothetical protein
LDDAISAETDKMTRDEVAPSLEAIDAAIGFWRMCNNLVTDTAAHPAQRINIGTRWAAEDLSHWIREEEVDVTTYDLPVHVGGVPTFPVMGDGSKGWDEEAIAIKRKRMGIFMFSGQYELNPVPKEKMSFKSDWIRRFTMLDLQDVPLNIYVCIDPAISESKGSDFTGIVVVGVSPDDHRWILAAEQHKIENPFKVAHRICDLAEHYSQLPTTNSLDLVVEDAAYQKALKFVIEAELPKRGLYVPTQLYKGGNRKKTLRIRGLEPIMSSGKLHILRDLVTFETQLLTWIPGKTKHEDLLDAACQHIQFATVPPRDTVVEVDTAKLHPFDMRRIRAETRKKTMAAERAERWGLPTAIGAR